MPQDPPAPDVSTDLRPTLLAGIRAVPRGRGTLLVGSGTQRVEVADTPPVRDLLADLARNIPVAPRDAATRAALSRLVTAGLTEARAARAARAAARSAARVLVDAPDPMAGVAVELLLSTGLAVTSRAERTTHALVAGSGEIDRGRLDRWLRRGVPHLLVVDHGRTVSVGPYVQPGLTCCAHCLDAHAGELDPAHVEAVSALARTPPLSPGDRPALATAALAWAVDDLVGAVDGRRPATWSATLTLGSGTDQDPGVPLSTAHRSWPRHPDCGCAWADDLHAGRAG